MPTGSTTLHPSMSSLFIFSDEKTRTTHPRDLGDRANLVGGQYRQALYVRHGGAVFSLALYGTNEWDTGRGKMPVDANGIPARPSAVDTSAFAKDLTPTMRTLMRALAQPPSSS